jgi:RimJ/RimL family protein N-acetyltransferase
MSTELATGATLQSLEPWRAEEFAAHLDRAREHIRPWVGPSFVTTSVEGARKTLERYANATARDGARIYGIWLDKTLIAGVMFVEFNAAAGVCEIGCWSEPAGEGKGHISAAVHQLLIYACEQRGLHRVEWRCRTDNERSIAVARRVGMTFEGELREAWLVDGTYYNKAVWSILASEVSRTNDS